MRHPIFAVAAVWCAAVALAAYGAGGSFSFAILGDRTGEAVDGVYQQVWKEAAAEKPAFVLTTGDSIQGLDDKTAEREWRAVAAIWGRRIALYLTPGNHDVWSAESAQLYRKYSGHPLHYSFDYEQLHVTVLDNSRTDELPAGELAFLESDLKAHSAALVKLVISHRPWWLLDAGFHNPESPMQRLARTYGVRWVIAGHVHQMLRVEVQGVTYLSMPSAGGHLRLSEAYRDGWFFGHARVEVSGTSVAMRIEEARAPHGEGRVTKASDWGMTGLAAR